MIYSVHPDDPLTIHCWIDAEAPEGMMRSVCERRIVSVASFHSLTLPTKTRVRVCRTCLKAVAKTEAA